MFSRAAAAAAVCDFFSAAGDLVRLLADRERDLRRLGLRDRERLDI